MDYEFLEHTADVKFKAYGKTVEEAFVNSARALLETIYQDTGIDAKTEKVIEVEGDDDKALLYNFLEEIIFLLDSDDFIVSEVRDLKIEGGRLGATLVGDDTSGYEFSNDVKAITYNDMSIKKKGNLWEVIGVFDV